MSSLTALTRVGKTCTPQFVSDIKIETCLGCGRCLKVCGRGVLGLRALDEEGEFVDDEDEEFERKVMTIVNGDLCIGCEACSRVCPKKCHTHVPHEQN